MTRSFTDRVFAGVCGGLGKATRINAWIWRILFVVLAIASVGAFLVAYLILWWIVPAESPATRRRGMPLFLVLALLAAAALLWYAELTGQLIGPTGISLYGPILLFALALVYLLRQFQTGGAQS